MSSIHGHQVLEMMINADKRYSTSSLIAAIEEKFGVNARFHTCSNTDMSAAELVDFLTRKGKFIAQEGGFITNEAMMCKH